MVARRKTISGDALWGAQMEYKIETIESNVKSIDQHLEIPGAIKKLAREKSDTSHTEKSETSCQFSVASEMF
jgi:hypothetical protein